MSSFPEVPMRRPPLTALTGLRFFAALHVVLYHLWRHDGWDTPLLVERVVRAGPASVTLFFVLSGFVLAYRYADLDGRIRDTRGFFRARLARVYPLHALGLLLALPVALVLWRRAGGGEEAMRSLLADGVLVAGLVQAWVPSAALALNPPAWSLSVEAFCYLLFPLVAPRVLALSRARALLLGAGLWAASLLASLGLALLADATPDEDVMRMLVHAFKFHPLVRLPDFVLGLVAARLFLDADGPPRPGPLAWACALASLAVAAAGLVPYALWHNGWLAPLFALVILRLCVPGALTRAFGARVFVRLGEASYALYALHVPLLYWIAGIGERRTGEKVLERPAVALSSLLFLIAASLLAHRLVEEPLRRRLRPCRAPCAPSGEDALRGEPGARREARLGPSSQKP